MAHKHILIVDDDPDMVMVMRVVLEAGGYKVSHASSGAEGLEKVKEIKPDLIILDMVMSTATEGLQVSLTLRSPDPKSEYAAFRQIPIMMFTAIHTTTPLRFGPNQNYVPVDEFVEKPIDPDVLLSKVAKLLGEK